MNLKPLTVEDIMEETVAEVVARVQIKMSAQREAYSFDKLKVGDYIQFYYMPYQHCATIRVTKINRVSFDGVERPGSYIAGRGWRNHKNWRDDIRLVTAEENRRGNM